MAQNPVITITMDNGDVIKAELYPEIAPVSVNNFISLVKKGFYDGLTFHRVIEGFMIQGGCPLGNGTGGPGYTIRGEFSQNGFHNPLKHEAGVLSMARAMHPDSAGSQFFIMHKAAPHLDGAYAAFGKVTDGLDVVNKIAETDTDWNDAPLDPQVIRTITVATFGVDYPEPEKCLSDTAGYLLILGCSSEHLNFFCPAFLIVRCFQDKRQPLKVWMSHDPLKCRKSDLTFSDPCMAVFVAASLI